MTGEEVEAERSTTNRREVRLLQNKLEGMIYTNEKVFREFGKLLTDDDRGKVEKVINRAKEAAVGEEKSKLNEAILDLQSASRILTSVMLYNPMKMSVPTDTPQ